MDRYTKFILTVIAVLLCLLVIRVWEQPVSAVSVTSKKPTVGDFDDVQKIKDADRREAAKKRLHRSVPVVKVYNVP